MGLINDPYSGKGWGVGFLTFHIIDSYIIDSNAIAALEMTITQKGENNGKQQIFIKKQQKTWLY